MAWRYLCILWLKGKRDVVAPTSAPMLQMVAMPGEGGGEEKGERGKRWEEIKERRRERENREHKYTHN